MDIPQTHSLIVHDAAPPAAAQQPGLLDMAPMFIAFLAIFYFLVIRPQQKEQSEHQKLIAGLQKGDKVVLRDGLHGVVHEVRQDTLLLTIADGVRVEVDKAAIKVKPAAQEKK
ncbi:MAG: preprotein translocase subunit YajC [Myxococcota bacterium]